MNFWDALGVSPQAGLLVAGAGLLAAFVLAAATLFRRSRAERGVGLGLDDRR